jgi:MFS family permease
MLPETSSRQTGSVFLKWYSLVIFCLIQIGTSSDNAVLSNATSSLLKTFHTTVSAIQLANTIYPLIAGALMIVAGILGLRWGWKRLLQLGVIFLIAAEIIAFLSPNMLVLSYVARVLAGLGASMAIPAILGLIAGIYNNKEQFIAFGAIAAANGFAGAAGPVIGGWLIVAYSWRFAFLVLAILFAISFIGALFVLRAPKPAKKPTFDMIGTVLIVSALAFFIYGLLQINQWGLIHPFHAPFTFFKLSPCLFFVAFGLILFYCFLRFENYAEKKGKDVLLPKIFMRTPAVRAGLYMTALVFLLLGGFTFVIVTFLQIVINYNAIQTGLVLMTYAIGMVLFSLGIPFLIKHPSPKKICRLGIIFCVVACVFLSLGLQISATTPWLLVGLFLVGAGSGMIASQSSVVITTAIPPAFAEQSGGIQGTMRNLGQALGIALIGVILITSLTHTVKAKTAITPYLTAPLKHKVQLIENVSFVSNQQVKQLLIKKKVPNAEQRTLIQINEQSRLMAARISIFSIGFIVLLFFFLTGGLPDQLKISQTPSEKKEQG